MKKVIVYLADGFEETEAMFPIDVMRRAGIDVVTASITDSLEVVSSHQVKIVADALAGKLRENDYDCVFLPGGMPGSLNLSQSWLVNERIISMAEKGKIVSAICAAPAVVLANTGLLDGRKATCYPGSESNCAKDDFLDDGVVVDGNIVTGKSAAYALDLGLKLVELLEGVKASEKVASALCYVR